MNIIDVGGGTRGTPNPETTVTRTRARNALIQKTCPSCPNPGILRRKGVHRQQCGNRCHLTSSRSKMAITHNRACGVAQPDRAPFSTCCGPRHPQYGQGGRGAPVTPAQCPAGPGPGTVLVALCPPEGGRWSVEGRGLPPPKTPAGFLRRRRPFRRYKESWRPVLTAKTTSP
jgi:hypothetical protein